MTRYEHIPSGLDTTTSKTCLKGLPRVRGDRPWLGIRDKTIEMSPPRARGSTSADAMTPSTPEVSPACAGIDLVRKFSKHPLVGLPRVRGDRPG